MTSSWRRSAAGLLIVLGWLCAASAAAGQGEVKEFRGDFLKGFYSNVGGVMYMVPMFMDKSRPASIPSANDKLSESALKAVCKNGDTLKTIPAGARQLDIMQRNAYVEALHIAVFPRADVMAATELKGGVAFELGPLTTLKEVVDRFGAPLEQEAWTAKDFQGWIGLNGIVSWWGAVGLAASPDGRISHILVREREGWESSIK